jgi:two-component system phosphate regulon sensor histidine kinase PhoR
MFKTFKFRLLASYLCVVFFSLGLASFLLDRAFEQEALRDLTSHMASQASLIESRVFPGAFRSGGEKLFPALAADIGPRLNERVTFISSSGRVLGDSGLSAGRPAGMENHAGRPEVASALGGKPSSAVRRSTTMGIEMLYFAWPSRDGGAVAGVIRLAVPLSGIKQQLAHIRRVILLSLAVSAVFAVLLGLWLIAVLARPFGDIINASKRFTAGDLDYRLRTGGSGELKKLAQTFNFMAEELSRKIGELSARKQEIEAVFNNMSEGIILTDGVGVIKTLNAAAERLTGMPAAQAAGRRVGDVFGGNGLDSAALETLCGGKPVSRELSAAFKERVDFQVQTVPVIEGGLVKGCVLVARDVTELKQAERMRKEFVANVSHELKTPLTAIKGNIETLICGAVDDRAHRGEFLDSVLRQADRLEGLVNDLLKLSNLESATVALELSEFRPRALAEETHAALLPAFKNKTLSFINSIPENITIRADRDKLEHILFNLLDNAFKFTPAGGRISVEAEESGACTKFLVKDTGAGVSAKDLPRLFERFYRVDKARSRELGGTGLGLSIVKHAVVLHGGSVGAESVEGRGSTFWFTIPKLSK